MWPGDYPPSARLQTKGVGALMKQWLVDRGFCGSGASCLVTPRGCNLAQFAATNGNLLGCLDPEAHGLAPHIHHSDCDAVSDKHGFADPSLQDEHLAILPIAPPVIVSFA